MALAIIALATTTQIIHAQQTNINVNDNKEPFMVEFYQLNAYLDLDDYQMDDVYNINEYFILQQKESLNGNQNRRDKRLQQAVYGNLKLMKQALNSEQYRKYVTLLNVTNNNKRYHNIPDAAQDVLYAENQ